MRVRYLGPYDTLILPKHSKRGDLVIQYGDVVTLSEEDVMHLMRTGRLFEEVTDSDKPEKTTVIDVPGTVVEEAAVIVT